MDKIKFIWGGILVAVVIAIGGYFFPQVVEDAFGRVGTAFRNGICVGDSSANCTPTQYALTIGSNGSTIYELKATTCELIGTNRTHTATSTFAYDCAITGLTSSDVVMAQIATSTDFSDALSGWSITAAKASSTSGFITVILDNRTGGSANPSATGVGSTTNVWYIDN